MTHIALQPSLTLPNAKTQKVFMLDCSSISGEEEHPTGKK